MRGKRIKGNALLFALATQGFDTYHLLGQFIVAQDQRVQRAALVGFLELALEKETTPWEMTVGMSEPTRSIHLQAVLQELKKE